MVKLVTRKRVTPNSTTRRWLKRAGLASCFLLLASCCLCLLFKSDLFVIKNINCSVKDKTSLADEKRWCEQAERLLLGQKIMLSNLTTVVADLECKFLPVGEVRITKKYPQTVTVEISERKPIVKVAQFGGREFLLDKEGVLYSEVVPEFGDLRLVTLELGTDLDLGQKIEADVVSLVRLEESPVQAIKFIGQEGIEVLAGNDLTILFSRQKNLTDQIRALQTVLKKYRIEGKTLKQIDLRYEQPVIKY
jgi:cell division septal protein FtsQ